MDTFREASSRWIEIKQEYKKDWHQIASYF